jgi:hypothetical protein
MSTADLSDSTTNLSDEAADSFAEECIHRALGVEADDEPEPPTPAQIAVAESLASGSTVSNAASAAGVERLTVDKWLDENASFIAELNARRRDRLDVTQSGLRNLADKAVTTIAKILDDDNAPAAVRFKIAQMVLETTGGSLRAETIGPCTPRRTKRAIERRKHDEWLEDLA